MRASWISVVLIASATTVGVRAQEPALTARLTKFATVDALDAVDAKPWHAVVEAEIFDAKGSNPTHGTIEVWQSGSDRRTLYTFGSMTMAEVVKGKAVYRTTADPHFPILAPFLLARVLHNGPVMQQVKQIEPVVQQRKVDGQKLDCITTKPPANAGSFVPPAYCVDAQDQLRAVVSMQQTVLLDAPGEFLGHYVSRRVAITNSGVPAATARITKLEVYEPSADEFMPTGDMKPFVPRARISGGVIEAQRTNFAPPIYPEAARARHLGGAVVLHAIIGVNGHVKTAEAVSSPSAELTQAAVDAVKQWTYKPYLLNGEPVEVETTITVNFALR
jgi:TonB family protein